MMWIKSFLTATGIMSSLIINGWAAGTEFTATYVNPNDIYINQSIVEPAFDVNAAAETMAEDDVINAIETRRQIEEALEETPQIETTGLGDDYQELNDYLAERGYEIAKEEEEEEEEETVEVKEEVTTEVKVEETEVVEEEIVEEDVVEETYEEEITEEEIQQLDENTAPEPVEHIDNDPNRYDNDYDYYNGIY